MYDYENYKQLFSMTLQQKLKYRIKGNIYVKVTLDDALLVVISQEGETIFKKFINNISDKIQNGLTTDYCVYEVMKEYRQVVIDIAVERYFY